MDTSANIEEYQMKENISLIIKVWKIFKNDLLKLVKTTEEDISIQEIIEIIRLIKDRLNLNSEEKKVIDKWTITLIDGFKKYDAKEIKIMDLTVKKLEKNFCCNIK